VALQVLVKYGDGPEWSLTYRVSTTSGAMTAARSPLQLPSWLDGSALAHLGSRPSWVLRNDGVASGRLQSEDRV